MRYSPNTLPNVTSVHFAPALKGFLSHDLVKHPLRPWYPLSISCIPWQGVPQATTAREGFSSLFFPLISSFTWLLMGFGCGLLLPTPKRRQGWTSACPPPDCEPSEAVPQSQRRSCKASPSDLSARIQLKTYRGKLLEVQLGFAPAGSSTGETSGVGLLSSACSPDKLIGDEFRPEYRMCELLTRARLLWSVFRRSFPSYIHV